MKPYLKISPTRALPFSTINPVHKKVPILIHNGKPIVESLVILEYIDETWKETSLLSEGLYERAMARFWAKFGDAKVATSIFQGFFLKEGKEKKEAMVEAMKHLQFLGDKLKGKRLFGGERIGFVDLALGWLANFISIFEEVVGLKIVGKDKFPLLFKWMKEFSDSPIIKDNWPPQDKMIAKFHALYDATIAAAAASK